MSQPIDDKPSLKGCGPGHVTKGTEFKFGHGLATSGTNLQMTNCPYMGVVRATSRIIEFHTPSNISGMAEARVVKFCVVVGYIKC